MTLSPNSNSWITKERLIENTLDKIGADIKPSTLRSWERYDFPKGAIVSLGGSKGKKTYFPSYILRVVETVIELRSQGTALSEAIRQGLKRVEQDNYIELGKILKFLELSAMNNLCIHREDMLKNDLASLIDNVPENRAVIEGVLDDLAIYQANFIEIEELAAYWISLDNEKGTHVPVSDRFYTRFATALSEILLATAEGKIRKAFLSEIVSTLQGEFRAYEDQVETYKSWARRWDQIKIK